MTRYRHQTRPSSAAYTTATVRMPTRLLAVADLDRGIYALVARCLPLVRDPGSPAARGHIPLSAADIGRYDPTVTYGAARRSLERLVVAGWLQPTRLPGQKTGYQPTWGRATCPLDLTQPSAGKPRSCAIIPLPAAILDHFLGVFTPHPVAPASIRRYTTMPLLRLTDVGAYLAALHGQPRTTVALERYGLIQDDHVCAWPDLTTTLARATQVSLTEPTAITLTPAGSAKLGLRVTPPPPQPAASTGHPLFFVAPGVIGEVIDQLIATGCPCQVSSSASVREKHPITRTASAAPWSSWTHESINHESPLQPVSHTAAGTTPCDDARQPALLPPDSTAPSPTTFRRELDITHKRLNPDRPILPGEWLELATLAQEHGVSALLIWQSRAQRAGCTRITPAYYHACAAQAALATYRPPRAAVGPAPVAPLSDPTVVPSPTPPGADQPVPVVPAPTLLQALGAAAGEPVRCPQLLAEVAPPLLTAWTRVVGHAGLRARFADPLGFAITQMRQGLHPPPDARLDAWATRSPSSSTPWTADDLATLTQHYGDLFRLGSGTVWAVAPRDGVVPAAGTPGPTRPHTADRARQPRGAPPYPLRAPALRPPAARPMRPDARDPGAGLVAEPVQSPPDAVTVLRTIQTALHLRAGRGPLCTLLNQVQLGWQRETLVIQCRAAPQLAQVHALLLPLLPTVLRECGVPGPVTVRIGDQSRGAPPDVHRPAD